MKVVGYNIMKQPTFQGVVKSTRVLVNGNKIFNVTIVGRTSVGGRNS
jgi:hypothetical protein